MRRVAIPISKGLLSEYFGQCNHYQIFELDGKHVHSHQLEVPPFKDVEKLPEWAASKGITDVITYRLDNQIIPLFSSNKITLFVGIPIDTPESIINSYMNGTLVSNSSVIN